MPRGLRKRARENTDDNREDDLREEEELEEMQDARKPTQKETNGIGREDNLRGMVMQDDEMTSTEYEPKTFLQLNDDCLSEVISHLGFYDRLIIRQVSKRLLMAEEKTRYPKERDELARLIFSQPHTLHSSTGALLIIGLRDSSDREWRWTTKSRKRARLMMERIASSFTFQDIRYYMDLETRSNLQYFSILPMLEGIGGKETKLTIVHRQGGGFTLPALLNCAEFMDSIETVKVQKLQLTNVLFKQQEQLEFYDRIISSSYNQVKMETWDIQMRSFAQKLAGIREGIEYASSTTRQDVEVRHSPGHFVVLSHSGWVTKMYDKSLFMKKGYEDLSNLVLLPYMAPG